MRSQLIASGNGLWRNVLGISAIAIIVPVALVVKFVTMPYERPVQRTANEVARYIRDFIEGTGGDWDWDDFESIPSPMPRSIPYAKRLPVFWSRWTRKER